MGVMSYVQFPKGFVRRWSTQPSSRDIRLNVTLPREVGACVGGEETTCGRDGGEVGGGEKG